MKINIGLYLENLFPGISREYKFHPTRKWRFDYCWKDKMIALECEGGTWTNGRHTRGKGYRNDCIKYSEAAILGWKVIRATTDMIKDGTAVELLERAHKEA